MGQRGHVYRPSPPNVPSLSSTYGLKFNDLTKYLGQIDGLTRKEIDD